jgi:hypothetical protein
MRCASLCLLLFATPATAAPKPQRIALRCLTIEIPAGTTQKPGNLPPEATAAGLEQIAFFGRRVQVDAVEYTPELSVTTEPAEGETADTYRDSLLETFKAKYEEVLRLASPEGGFRASDLKPPKVVSAKVGGIPGHRWQVDAIATFEGHRVAWRAFNLTTVYRGRAYVITAAGAVQNSTELRRTADRLFASASFEACR